MSLASQLVLECFARPDNTAELPRPLSRFSSSESIPKTEGNGHIGSVAEKALLFELNASLNSSNGGLKPTNGKLSPSGQRSPSRFSVSPQPKRKNDNHVPLAQDPLLSAEKSDTVVKASNGTGNNNNNSYVPYQAAVNKSWADATGSAAAGSDT